MKDISEQLIKDRIKDLRENTDFVSTLLESLVGYAIIAADFDGNVIAFNEGACQIYGYALEEVIGEQNIEIFFPKDFIQAGKLHQIIGGLIEKGKFSYEGEKVRKNGERFPAQVLFTLTKDNNGKVIGFIEIVEDLTERKKMQAQLVQTEKMTAVGMLAAGVAHELNNPMMGILNFAQYCLKHTSEDDPRYVVLQDIERETRRSTDIVSNLLTFSHKYKAGKGEYEKASFHTIVEGVIRLVAYRIEKEHVSVTHHIAEGTPEIWMHVNRMQQVLLNLMTNALNALNDSEEKEIHIEVHRQGEFVQLSVSDSGHGIATENLGRIYDPFFTTRPVRQGTGLGLSVSRNIVLEHGGEISCQSKPGFGTTFTILLPVERKGGKEYE